MEPGAELTRDVVRLVAEVAELDPGEVSLEASFEELGIDSLDGLRIVAAVEKKYGVVIDEAEINRIRTMQDVLALARRHAPGGE